MTIKSASNPVLENTWMRFNQLDQTAMREQKPYFRLRIWILVLGVLATLFTILTDVFSPSLPSLGRLTLQIILIAIPILSSTLAAFLKQYYAGANYLVLRAGAEEIKIALYTYRTILKHSLDRREWLEKRVSETMRQVYRSLGGEMILQDVKVRQNPYYTKGPDSDLGLQDLTGDQYYRLRLQDQLTWHSKKILAANTTRRRLLIYILSAGAIGAFLAAMGGPLTLWVALTASLAAALVSYQDLRNSNFLVQNYSKVVLELSIIADHWVSLEPEEQDDAEFFNMVQSTEDVLRAQTNEFTKTMREALDKLNLDEEADLVLKAVDQAREADMHFKQARRDAVLGGTARALEAAEETTSATVQAAVGALYKEASSDLVQQELAAMGKAVTQAAEALVGRGSRFRHSLDEIAAQFADLKVGKETPVKELNAMISKFPPTGEIKG